ncbi:antagonist of mitotic exit network protein, putative [Phanerochaete sordida]|uniref:Antagonist of mitotic exit network protein, putative n=1 Tax=Phanerochaete sordida TaxID=48140 RepID=A0A9P3FZN2_9APHY|nr:antagonist of mitotic exit network protein, putative [Phanerochaete sordida]
MSHPHDIDNGGSLFDYDTNERFEPLSLLEDPARAGTPSLFASSHFVRAHFDLDDPPLSRAMSAPSSPEVKGKQAVASTASEPMSIPLSEVAQHEPDVFALSYAGEGSSSSRYDSRLSYAFPPSQHVAFGDVGSVLQVHADGDPNEATGKGKGRELPPTLPPLSFSPTRFSYETEWSSMAGPSSCGSSDSSMGGVESSPGSPSPMGRASDCTSAPSTPALPQTPAIGASRRRTISSVSRHSLRSLSTPSLPRMKVKFATSKGAPGSLARKLLFKKSPPTSPRTPPADLGGSTVSSSVHADLTNLQYLGPGTCAVPWSRDMPSRSPLASPVVETNTVWGVVDSQRVLRGPIPVRTKGRAYSSPLPLPAFSFDDIVPLAPADLYEDSVEEERCYLEELLPHELKLHILVLVVELHQAEYEGWLANGKLSARKTSSSRKQWVGREAGIRELFKLSRISRSFRQLVFDGQLWSQLDLRSFPKLAPSVIVRLAQVAGGFARSLDLTAHGALPSSTLADISHHLAVQSPPSNIGFPHNNLTHINFQGCFSMSSRALHHILLRSPRLQRLYLRGQFAVTNATVELLANHCPRLVVLDLGRCRNMDAEGIRAAAATAVGRGEQIALKELRLSGLKGVNDDMMTALGRAAPFLEVLDLSYTTAHNSAIEAFVSCTEEDTSKLPALHLSARDAGRDPSDSNRYWRRVTSLRHLNLSSCVLLTDHACSHLAHAVPKLEFLELAGIGPELRNDGLVRLLSTTPLIRRLDLEDATEVTDAVLLALTPAPPPPPAPPAPRGAAPPAPEPGHALEHLVLSYANVESDALAELIRRCPRLRTLEADNTRMTGLVLREFVQAMRARKTPDARIVAVDCRSVGEHVVKDLAPQTRPRLGWRSWHARKLAYLDARDKEDLGVGQDECDPARVVVKSFYSWQTVDAVKAAREKKRLAGSRRANNASENSSSSEHASTSSPGRARWWSPSGRRSSGLATPTLLDNADRGEGCTIM